MDPELSARPRRTLLEWWLKFFGNPYVFLSWLIIPLLFLSFDFPTRFVYDPVQIIFLIICLHLGLGLAKTQRRRFERDFFVCVVLYLIFQPVSEFLLTRFVHGVLDLVLVEISYLIAIGVIFTYLFKRGYTLHDVYLRRFRPDVLLLALLIAVLAWAGLIFFLITQHDSPQAHVLAALKSLPVPLLVLQALSFASFNAFSEEMVFRGIIFGRARPVMGRVAAAYFSALCFAVIHYYGVPWGWWGMFLAFWFGAGMALLTDISKSIWPAWLVHFSADLVVFFVFYNVPK